MHAGRLPGLLASLRSLSGSSAWLAYLFYPLALLPPVADRAARHARYVLDGLPGADPEPPLRSSWRPRAAQLPHFKSISLRQAAHVVTLAVVCTVLLLGRSSAATLNVIDTLLAPPRAASRGAADLRVAHLAAASVDSSGADSILPVEKAASAQLELPFVDSHMLAEGETLGQVAAQYHVSVASLFWANDLASQNVFAAGQELRIPRMAGIPHIVEEGETLAAVAERYHVQPEAIVLFKPNGVQADQPLPVGREIFVPNGTEPYPADLLARLGGEQGIAGLQAVAAGVVQETDTNLRSGPSRDYPRLGTLDAGRRLKLLARHEQWVKVEDAAGQTGWVRGDLLGLTDETLSGLPATNDFPPPPVRWMWPTRGEITSPFGWRRQPWRMFHDGLDIANSAGTKIYAARSGRVFEAGWCSGFGYCVKIDHGDGFTTIYGHMLKRPVVRAGNTVDAGDLIGLMGSSFDRAGGGYSTGVHLHFTVKLNGKAVNPLKFLP